MTADMTLAYSMLSLALVFHAPCSCANKWIALCLRSMAAATLALAFVAAAAAAACCCRSAATFVCCSLCCSDRSFSVSARSFSFSMKEILRKRGFL